MKPAVLFGGLCIALVTAPLDGQESPLGSRAGRIDLVQMVILERARTIGTSMRVDLCTIEAFVGPGPDVIPLLEPRTRPYVGPRPTTDCRNAAPPTRTPGLWDVSVMAMRPDSIRVLRSVRSATAVDTTATVLLTAYGSGGSRSEEYIMTYLAGRWSGALSVRLFNFEYH